MRLLWRVRVSILLVVLLALLSYGSSEHDPALGAAVMIAATAGWWFTEFRINRGLPRWLTNLLLVGLVLGAAWRVFSGGVLVSAFTGFLAALLVIKMWERRRPSDYGQLLTMSLFLLVGATLTDNTLGVGLSLIVFLPVFVWAVLLYQLFAPAFRAIPNADRAWLQGESAIRPYSSTMTIARGGWCRLVSVGIIAVMGASAVAVCVFLFVPRGIGLGRMGEFGRAVTGRTTGFNDRVQLGQGGLISQSQERVLEVNIMDTRSPASKAATPVRYLRGAVLEEYHQGAWTKIESSLRPLERRHIPIGTRSELYKQADYTHAVIHQDISLLSAQPGDTPLFGLYRPYNVEVSDMVGSISFDRFTGVLTRRGPAGRVEYSITSIPDEEPRGTGDSVLPRVGAVEMEWYLRRRQTVSFPSSRIRELAISVLRERGIEPDPSVRPIEQDLTAARTLRTHLEHRATYTLDILAAPAGQDPTEWFCFDAKSGHCEYFASALAAMCRSVGIDARVVTGYATGEIESPASAEANYNNFGRDTYIVRASNAHAWVEARVAPDRWVTLDATPPGELTRIASPTATLNGRFWRWLDGVENIWATHVVSFDNKQQTELFGRGVRLPWLERAVDWMRRQTRGEPGGRRFQIDLQRLLTGITLVVLGGVIVHAALRRRRMNRAVALTQVEIDPAARRVRDSLLDALSKRGYPKPAHAPLLSHARAIDDAALATEATRVAVRLYDAVFGERTLSQPEMHELVAIAKSLARAR